MKVGTKVLCKSQIEDEVAEQEYVVVIYDDGMSHIKSLSTEMTYRVLDESLIAI